MFQNFFRFWLFIFKCLQTVLALKVINFKRLVLTGHYNDGLQHIQ